LTASSQEDRSDRFVDDDGKDLSGFPPIEVEFEWKATDTSN
jgi:hypothetical protein